MSINKFWNSKFLSLTTKNLTYGKSNNIFYEKITIIYQSFIKKIININAQIKL
jgi:hypothetical protein